MYSIYLHIAPLDSQNLGDTSPGSAGLSFSLLHYRPRSHYGILSGLIDASGRNDDII